MSDHPIIPAVHRNLCASDFSEERAGHGGDHVADVLGFDLHLHEVFGLVLLDGHAVASGAFLKGLGGPELGVEDGVRVDDVDADFVRGQLKGGDSAELRERSLGAGVCRPKKSLMMKMIP